MAFVARYLADTSALARMKDPIAGPRIRNLIDRGLLATCAAIDFEILWSTRTVEEFVAVREARAGSFEELMVEPIDWNRALNVQEELWSTGQIRAVPLPDLLVAAVAERHRVTVLHYDADYDRIAEITNQPTEWIVPAGTVA